MKFKSGEEFVKSLAIYSPPPNVTNTIRLETYFLKCGNLYNEALESVKANDEPRAYIHLMRFAKLFTELASHSSYPQKQFEREKSLNRRRCNNALIKLEELKPKLIAQYNQAILDEIEQQKMPPSLPDESKETNDSVPNDTASLSQDNENKSNVTTDSIQQDKKNLPSSLRWNNLLIPEQPVVKPPPPTNPFDSVFSDTEDSVIVPETLIPTFIRYAESNTSNDIETCGILTGKYVQKLKSYVISVVILPKQKGSPNTVHTLNEEELIQVQEDQGLITLGWIHTHPSQTCFLSSVDLHSQLCYQIMMPESIAIVYAPRDTTKVFRLTQEGISVLSKCGFDGFHKHGVEDGLYEPAKHAKFSKNFPVKYIDLRNK